MITKIWLKTLDIKNNPDEDYIIINLIICGKFHYFYMSTLDIFRIILKPGYSSVELYDHNRYADIIFVTHVISNQFL